MMSQWTGGWKNTSDKGKGKGKKGRQERPVRKKGLGQEGALGRPPQQILLAPLRGPGGQPLRHGLADGEKSYFPVATLATS